MACYHPLKGWLIGTTCNGKPNYKVTSYETEYVYFDRPDHFVAVARPPWVSSLEFESRKLVDRLSGYGMVEDFIEIPCGHCIGCRLDYSRTWANRCMLELQYHKSAWFVTLTYDDVHLPHGMYVDDDGNLCQSDSLYARDLQLFLKKLRRRCEPATLRFYGCGEYGSQSARPHYHVIIYGLELHDLQLYKRQNGYQYYTSEFLSDVWRDDDGDGEPRGFVVVGEVSWETCAYVARYVTKKLGGQLKEVYDKYDIEPEFCRMSRRPGIAAQYYEEHKDYIYEFDQINIKTAHGGKSFKPPRYFDTKFDLEYPEQFAEIKERRRKAAELITAAKIGQTDLNYLDMLGVAERYKIQAARKLVRDL